MKNEHCEDDIYAASETFRLPLRWQRALMNAADEKRVSKSRVIMCCLMGEENLSRYIDEFTREDLKWVHQQELRIFDEKEQRKLAKKASKAHESIDADLVKKMRT